MKIIQAIEAFINDQPVVVKDITVQSNGFEEVTLETGEVVYWIYTNTNLWLSLDPTAEEIILFEEIPEELEPEDETVVYQGEDFEFSYEGIARHQDGDTSEIYNFREYENSHGKIVRITEDETTGNITIGIGTKVTEDELQTT